MRCAACIFSRSILFLLLPIVLVVACGGTTELETPFRLGGSWEYGAWIPDDSLPETGICVMFVMQLEQDNAVFAGSFLEPVTGSNGPPPCVSLPQGCQDCITGLSEQATNLKEAMEAYNRRIRDGRITGRSVSFDVGGQDWGNDGQISEEDPQGVVQSMEGEAMVMFDSGPRPGVWIARRPSP
jgi:hypothetical protein